MMRDSIICQSCFSTCIQDGLYYYCPYGECSEQGRKFRVVVKHEYKEPRPVATAKSKGKK